ncbi:MAG: 3-phosphoshikimate 1-carboxyvinyltransferase [Tissierellia bacterium]|nr:3-phosphoshikimate 1-carboxyvinyltransferase [Tissierellia bacterium]
MKLKGIKKLTGEIKVPGDKSISHRSIIFGAISQGETKIDNILLSDDTLKTIQCFKDMGIEFDIDEENNRVNIKGKGLNGLREPKKPLDCGNSGTTMRLLAGLLVGQNFSSTLIGDSSLSKRPMDRIIIPLTKMGGNIKGAHNKYPPLEIEPSEKLNGITYELPVASAQVKSAILLASIYSQGESKIIEKKVTRDHTERMLDYFREKDFIGRQVYIPGDISSAAYFIVAASIIKDSSIVLKDIGVNPTRTGIIDVLKEMGANIEVKNVRIVNNEPIGDIYVSYAPLKGISVDEGLIGRLIDEIPILAVAAAFAEGTTTIRGAEELKFKESNRIEAIAKELSKMSVDISPLPDGLIIKGGNKLTPAKVNAHKDHRIAMALSIAALAIEGESEVIDSHWVNISYPDFYDIIFTI